MLPHGIGYGNSLICLCHMGLERNCGLETFYPNSAALTEKSNC